MDEEPEEELIEWFNFRETEARAAEIRKAADAYGAERGLRKKGRISAFLRVAVWEAVLRFKKGDVQDTYKGPIEGEGEDA
jgi:hypothetical protein